MKKIGSIIFILMYTFTIIFCDTGFGNLNVESVYLGNTNVKKVYKGSNLQRNFDFAGTWNNL